MTNKETFPFNNPELSLKERLDDLIERLEDDEKLRLLRHDSPGIERLGINPHNWWNECLHGVGRSGVATIFPQAIGLAATFDTDLVKQVATVCSDEARAKHHEAARHNNFGMYKGLSYWTPNINIFRDPRWGRGQETYGEDPFLTSQLVISFVEGLQGDDENYIKIVATPKHFAVHSGPEALRHSFDATTSQKDLWETYLPAFFAGIVEAGAFSTMGAYNRTNGEPCCAHSYLLDGVLRDQWDFDGYVVSDCWAIQDFHDGHNVTKTPQESAALAIKYGCDLNCGCEYKNLQKALDENILTMKEVEVCLRRILEARMRLGMFDTAEKVPYSKTPFEVVACKEHLALARKTAADSCVLLRNDDNLLPLKKADYKRIAIVGPNATNDRALIGNYHGEAAMPVNILRGICEALPDEIEVLYSRGCDLIPDSNPAIGTEDRHLSEGISVAERSDIIIAVMGLDATLEGEQGDASNADASGDRSRLGLPGLQEDMLKELLKLGKPLVLITMAGSPISMPWSEGKIKSHLHVWYPGQEGGRGVADVLFGNIDPSGRLPITFPKSTDDLPPIEDYSMAERTYRYSTKEPMYSFGYGLSYTSFEYSNLKLNDQIEIGKPVNISFEITNIGNRTGTETIQVYLKHTKRKEKVIPHHQLVGIRKVTLKSGDKKSISMKLPPRRYSFIDEEGRCCYEAGEIEIFIGGTQPDKRSIELSRQKPVSAKTEITGEAQIDVEYGSSGKVKRRHRLS